MTKTFDMIMTGLDEVETYLDGNRQGFITHSSLIADYGFGRTPRPAAP